MPRRIEMKDNMHPIAKRLVKQGMTKKTLAEKSGVPLATIDQWTRRVRKPRDVYQLQKIAKALDCYIEDLIEPEG